MHQKLLNLFNKGKKTTPQTVFIVAEIGKNFIQSEDERSVSEYLDNGKYLIDLACEAGADAVKFQTHDIDDELTKIPFSSPHFKTMNRYPWVERNTRSTPVQFWSELKKYAEGKGLIFFSTPMSRGAAMKLQEIGVPLWKVGSGDVDDFVLHDFITSTGKPVIVSSGMVSREELDRIIKYLLSRKVPIGLLYCISQYPCPPEQFNLSTMEQFIKKYPEVMIGFSDHSVSSHEPSLAAIKLGAKMIEKHFSLSRDLWGPDHKASLNPEEFKELVRLIREGKYENVDVTKYYGDPNKELEGATNIYRPYFRKTLAFGKDLPKGHKITKSDLVALRPRVHLVGFSPERMPEVLGKKTSKMVKKHTPVSEDLFV